MNEQGSALLEVVVALAILAAVGLASVALSSDSVHQLRRVRAIEGEFREASQFLDAVALWPRSDLDRHLGTRREGPWLLRVDRPDTTLYTVRLLEPSSGRPILRTVLYRPR